jgi:hypothetical protein
MHTLTCKGRDGIVRTFSYACTPPGLDSTWTYRVQTIPPVASGEFFELSVSEIEAGTVRVVATNNYRVPEYTAMGIPEALLPVVKQELQMEVESSPKAGSGDVYRTNAATNYWRRLEALGRAAYDSERDVYRIV